VEPACQAAVLADRTIRIDLSSVAGAATHSSSSSSSTDSLSVAQSVIQVPDAVKRSIFAHRFMSIAEQMGRTLQRTAVSTNIKERLDFSCALFDAKGGLVANAPHIPVHLGSMQDAVRQQVTLLGADWLPGEVVMTNHPAMGGTHLPDITVITPVFHDGRPVFFVASRGHHADVGGLTPGSMPPFSRTLAEEGAAIASLKLVQGGVFQEGRVRELLQHAGCRCLHDVLSDLRAQIAANQRGIQLMNQLIQEQGLGVVEHFMHEIQRTAAGFVRDVLRQVGKRHGKRTPTGRWLLEAADVMDDGSRIQLRVEIDDNDNDNDNNNNNDNDNNVDDGCSAVFDFTGTDAQVVANWNAPR
jgi:5-oxoprolinase (ATP-hydrolysing)